MRKGIFAKVGIERLEELESCGAVDPVKLDGLAQLLFLELKDQIKFVRGIRTKKSILKGFFDKKSFINREVDNMFPTRREMIGYLSANEVPNGFCPVSKTQKDRLIFLDRASDFTTSAKDILELFEYHDEIFVDMDKSFVIEWVLYNKDKIVDELEGEVC